jgi:hypothetical protein
LLTCCNPLRSVHPAPPSRTNPTRSSGPSHCHIGAMRSHTSSIFSSASCCRRYCHLQADAAMHSTTILRNDVAAGCQARRGYCSTLSNGNVNPAAQQGNARGPAPESHFPLVYCQLCCAAAGGGVCSFARLLIGIQHGWDRLQWAAAWRSDFVTETSRRRHRYDHMSDAICLDVHFTHMMTMRHFHSLITCALIAAEAAVSFSCGCLVRASAASARAPSQRSSAAPLSNNMATAGLLLVLAGNGISP